MRADIVVTIQSNKIVSNEVKDSKTLLPVILQEKKRNFLANPIVGIILRVPCP